MYAFLLAAAALASADGADCSRVVDADPVATPTEAASMLAKSRLAGRGADVQWFRESAGDLVACAPAGADASAGCAKFDVAWFSTLHADAPVVYEEPRRACPDTAR